jgi:hypothetical protein
MTGMTALASIRLWLSVNVSTPQPIFFPKIYYRFLCRFDSFRPRLFGYTSRGGDAPPCWHVWRSVEHHHFPSLRGLAERLAMPPQLLDDVQHWRDRAKESRVLAGQINDALAREMMLRVASNYERMAEQASGRQDQDEGRVR